MRHKGIVLVAFVFTVVGACSPYRYIAAPKRDSVLDLDPPAESEEYRLLASPLGPARFARVADGVYRGGQPTLKDLQALYALGVRTDINLRREDGDAWRQEKINAEKVGMKFLHFPFYGVFGAEEAFLDRIVSEIKKGKVYVHCKHGRDRTSLLVALYRVKAEAWEPKIAWKLEAVDYGSAQTYWYRQLRFDFERIAKKIAPPIEMPGKPIEPHPAIAAENMVGPVQTVPGVAPGATPVAPEPPTPPDPDVQPKPLGPVATSN